MELLSLWLCQVCYGSLGDNQICVKLKNDSSTVQCHYCALATFSEVVAQQMTGVIVKAEPADACSEVKSQKNYNTSRYIGNWFLLIDGDGCGYETKTLYAIEGGFQAAVIIKNGGLKGVGKSLRQEEEDEFTIPVIYVSKDTGLKLEASNFEINPNARIIITENDPYLLDYQFYMIPFAIIVGICFVLMAMFMISRYYRHYLEQRRNRLSPTNLRKIPTKKFKKGEDYYDVCAICLDEYKDGDRLRILPCEHAYHCKCVDPWLTEGKRTCPVCKRPAINDKKPRNRQRSTDVEAVQETNNEPDETTPLISPASLTSASTSLSV